MLTSIAFILLLGLLLGILLSPYAFNLIDGSILNISVDLRQTALVIILTRAGLSLEISDLKKVGRPAVLMCFVPACMEILGTVLLAPILLGVTILEAAIIGSVIAAVSPAVIIPRMIRLIEEGYGVKQGIPQMILAGASVVKAKLKGKTVLHDSICAESNGTGGNRRYSPHNGTALRPDGIDSCGIVHSYYRTDRSNLHR